jgi:hypothetical protein
LQAPVKSAFVLLVAAGVIGAGGAALGVPHAPTSVTLKSPEPKVFKGRVSSPKARCVPSRTVKLFQRRLDRTAALISRRVSDKRGIWRIDLEGELTGKFFAKVKFREVGSFLCKGGRSTAIHIRP